MKDKLKLWNEVSTTDPKYTKKVNQRGGFTAIAAQSQVMKATEMFGAFGYGWGVKEESIERWQDCGLAVYQATLWYLQDGIAEEGEVPLHSSIKYSSNGRIDDDFFKKVATDALTKGLSKLGFNADVFMGLFDDNKYVSQVKEQFIDDTWKKEINQVVENLPESDKSKIVKAIKDGKVNSKNYKTALKRAKELMSEYEEAMIEAKRNESLGDGLDGVPRVEPELQHNNLNNE